MLKTFWPDGYKCLVSIQCDSNFLSISSNVFLYKWFVHSGHDLYRFSVALEYHVAWVNQQCKIWPKFRARTCGTWVFNMSFWNRFAPFCEMEHDAVITRDRIVQLICAALAKGIVQTQCFCCNCVLDVYVQFWRVTRASVLLCSM